MRNFETRLEKLEQLAAATIKPEAPKVFIDFSDVHEAISKLQDDTDMSLDEVIANAIAGTADLDEGLQINAASRRR